MKTKPAEMIEGRDAFDRFKKAAKVVLSVPKSAVPEPFGKPQRKIKKRPTRQG
jgi:hypothetical protein